MSGLRDVFPAGGMLAAATAALAALATLAAVAALATAREASRLDAAAAEITVQVIDADPARQAARAAVVAAMLARRSDVVDARPLSPAMLTPAAAGPALPAIVAARLVHGADGRGMRRTFAAQPGISVRRDGQEARPLADAAAGIARIAGTVAGLALAGGAAAGAVAARATLRSERGAVAALRQLGAEDGQIAAALQRNAAAAAAIGAGAGTLAGAAAIPFIAGRLAAAEGPATAAPMIDPAGWLVLAAIPPLLTLLAIGATRATALLVLARRR